MRQVTRACVRMYMRAYRFTSQKLHHGGAPCIYETIFEEPKDQRIQQGFFADQPNMLFGTKHFREYCAHVQLLVCSLAPKL